MVLYVDDGLVIGKEEEQIDKVLLSIKKEFEITTSKATQYIGIEIDQDENGIRICQSKYVEKILKDFQMEEAKAVATPSVSGTTEEKKATDAPYREAVGALMFLASVSRPHIAFATGKVARRAANPTQSDWIEVKRILRYLKGAPDLSINYPRDGLMEIEGYCDADYGGDEGTRKSTSGIVITLNQAPVIWSSRLQRTVSTSTTEAEYNAMSDITKETIWARGLLDEIAVKQEKPTTIFCDNQSTLKIANNEEACRKTKHIAIKTHLVKDEIKRGTIETKFVASEEQKADMMTKSLTKESFIANRNRLNLFSRKTAIAYLCVMILTSQVMTGTAMFTIIPPVVWKDTRHSIVTGADLGNIRLQLISPCESLKELNNGTLNEQAITLETWCSSLYETQVMQRLRAHQTSHKRNQRDVTSLLLAGTSAGLLPAIGIPIAVVSIVGVVLFGVISYIKVTGRISDLEQQNEVLNKGVHDLSVQQIEIEKKINSVIESLETLAEKHNKLARDFERLKRGLIQMMVIISEVSSKLSATGLQLEESLREWTQGRVSESLFKALDIKFP